MTRMRLAELQQRRALECRLTPDRALGSLDEAEAFLLDRGLLTRTAYAEVPPRVEYSLTAKGRALIPIIEGMRTYGERWLGAECATEPAVGLEPVAVAV